MAAGKLHLLCGKMASGKSTLAARLSEPAGILLFSEDELLAKLYPDEIVNVQTYLRYSTRIKSALRSHLAALLDSGISLVLDFPANTKDQRSWLIGLAEKDTGRAQLHYLECADELCLQRLKSRAIAQAERAQTDTVAMFEAMTQYFEVPDESEGFEVITHRQHQDSDLLDDSS